MTFLHYPRRRQRCKRVHDPKTRVDVYQNELFMLFLLGTKRRSFPSDKMATACIHLERCWKPAPASYATRNGLTEERPNPKSQRRANPEPSEIRRTLNHGTCRKLLPSSLGTDDPEALNISGSLFRFNSIEAGLGSLQSAFCFD